MYFPWISVAEYTVINKVCCTKWKMYTMWWNLGNFFSQAFHKQMKYSVHDPSSKEATNQFFFLFSLYQLRFEEEGKWNLSSAPFWRTNYSAVLLNPPLVSLVWCAANIIIKELLAQKGNLQNSVHYFLVMERMCHGNESYALEDVKLINGFSNGFKFEWNLNIKYAINGVNETFSILLLNIITARSK